MNLLKKKIVLRNSARFRWHYVLYMMLLLCAGNMFAQFTVVAIPTHETCSGNGALTLSVQNAGSDSSVNYKVYLLPNTTTAIFNSSGTSVTGLNDGTYLVVATQVINGNTVQDEVEAVIQDQTTSLTFEVESTNALCGPDGQIKVVVTGGNAVSYELISGPVTRAPQPSNIFDNIPAGQYMVRVTNNCGVAIVTTYLVESDASVLQISPPMFPGKQLPACDLIVAAHDILPQQQDMEVQTPLQVTYTVYPPGGGAPVVFTQTVNNVADGPDVFQTIPFYHNTPYNYDLKVIDACGTVYNITDNLVNQRFRIMGSYGNAGCPGKYLIIALDKYVGPYQITFTEWPPEFNPLDFNPGHPGPFMGDSTSYGNEEGMAVPYGNYSFSITDACGRTATVEDLLLEEEEIYPSVAPTNSDCLNGMGGVTIGVSGYKIVSAFITEAPDEYPNELDDDISEYIDEEFKIKMQNVLPPGDYTVTFTDECDREFTEEFTVGTSSTPSISSNVRVDCAPGMGSASIASSTDVLKVIITQAPPEFTATIPVPHNASYNINAGGDWYMNNLPPGQYKFVVDDHCVTDFMIQKNVPAYTTSQNDLTIVRNCGSFDLLLEHATTSTVFIGYWLQKEIFPGVWGHPATGVPYTGGDFSTTNSVSVTNNVFMNSLPYTGTFRIVKRFKAFGTGRSDDNTPDQVDCIEVLHEGFEFNDNLDFVSIQNLTCDGDIADVQVLFQGAEPITYKITEKDGEPFLVDNGTYNIFTGLEPGQYTILAEDPCGNRTPITFSVADLPSLVTATAPPAMSLCDSGYDNTEVFDLSSQTAAILDGQNPAGFTVSYHTSMADAEAGSNPLPLSCNLPNTTVYARVLNNLNTACHAITSFDVVVMPQPQIHLPDTFSICEGEDITIYGDPGYRKYKWDGIEGGPFVTYSQAGTHTLTVVDNNGCEATKSFTVNTSSAPTIATIEIDDWTAADNTITVITQPSPSSAYYEYSLDGHTYQASNIFTGLAPGAYTVYVRDIYECGADEGEVYLLTYPKFFTPNGDGINDRWRIQFSVNEPDMLIYIYDRYGKLVSSFDAMSTGWDGTYNGSRLPATDYWFVVKRQNGKEYKGHFSMIR